MSNTPNSSIEDRALALLGNGVGPEIVASALGVTPARISQLTSQDEFATRLIALRYENLSRHNARDLKYDTIEDQLIDQLEASLPLLFRPEQILKAVQVINAAKRRGVSAPAQVTAAQTVVNITMPVKIINKFTKNIMNQVVEAGEQKLVTIQSGSLLNTLKEAQARAEQGRLLEGNGVDYGHERAANSHASAEATGTRSFESQGDTFVPATPA